MNSISKRRNTALALSSSLLLALAPACTGSSGDADEAENDSGSSAPLASLVEMDDWEMVAGADDVFGDRPASPVCPRREDAFRDRVGWYPEPFNGDPSLSVDTNVCEYLTISQPTALALLAGDTVEVRLFHFKLESPDPNAEAHLAIALDRSLVWEEQIAIPAAATFFDARFQVPADLPAGTPIDFHIHNHGPNNYALLEIGRPDAE